MTSRSRRVQLLPGGDIDTADAAAIGIGRNGCASNLVPEPRRPQELSSHRYR